MYPSTYTALTATGTTGRPGHAPGVFLFAAQAEPPNPTNHEQVTEKGALVKAMNVAVGRLFRLREPMTTRDFSCGGHGNGTHFRDGHVWPRRGMLRSGGPGVEGTERRIQELYDARRVPAAARRAGASVEGRAAGARHDRGVGREHGDRSENGDYIYGKRKLREIDRRIRHLSKSLDSALVVDSAGRASDRVFFGATVTIMSQSGDERVVTIVGIDELDSGDERVSWRSPLATALLKARVNDVVTVRTPRGPERLEVVAIRYDRLI